MLLVLPINYSYWHYDNTYYDFTCNDLTYIDFTYDDFTYNDFTCNDITFNWFYLKMTLLITVNKNMCVLSYLLMLLFKLLWVKSSWVLSKCIITISYP